MTQRTLSINTRQQDDPTSPFRCAGVYFDNGDYCLSLQFGPGSYSDNHQLPFESRDRTPESFTVEVAVIDRTTTDRKKRLLQMGNDTVAPWVSVEAVPDILVAFRNGNLDEVRKLCLDNRQ